MLPKISFDFISIFSIIGMNSGILLAILIGMQYKKNRANIYLSLALFSFAVSIVYGLFHNNNLKEMVPGLMWIGFPFQLMQGPAIFLYVKRLTTPRAPLLRKTDLLHFSPFLLYELWLIPFFMGSTVKKLGIMEGNSSVLLYQPGVIQLSGILIMVQVITYITLIIIVLIKYTISLKEYFSSVHKQQLSWLLIFCGGYTLVWSIFILVSSLGFTLGGVPLAEYLPVLVTAAILFIGIRGMSQDTIFLPSSFTNSQNSKYSGSTLKPGEAEIIRDRLKEQLSEKKIFTEPELSLGELATKIRCPAHHLSQVINQNYKTNFNEFINNERAQLAAELLESHPGTAILQIAMDAGFGTKSSFNSFFKKTYNMTPSSYRKLKTQS